jgi:putative membrane protein
MHTFATIMVGLVAVQHVYILVLEMFLWQKPLGRKTFRTTPEQAKETAVLAANQGLYNGFLAAGLLWAVVYPSDYFAHQLAVFFLGCVIVAACYGGYSVGRKILIIQGVPALIAFVATLCWAP